MRNKLDQVNDDMYTILFNQDKQLIQTGPIPLFVGEHGLTQFRFLIPSEIKGEDVSDCKVIVRYQLPNGSQYRMQLKKDDQMYKNYMSFRLTLTEAFTANSGYVYYNVTLIKIYEAEGSFQSTIYESDADFIEIRKTRDFVEVENKPEVVTNTNIYWYEDVEHFPSIGNKDGIYIATSNNKIYRWDDMVRDYVAIGSDYPVAKRNSLGMVKIGDNLDISEDGTISIAKATDDEMQEMVEEVYHINPPISADHIATDEEVGEVIAEAFR